MFDGEMHLSNGQTNEQLVVLSSCVSMMKLVFPNENWSRCVCAMKGILPLLWGGETVKRLSKLIRSARPSRMTE